jgi:hypothetical protein
MPSTYVFQRYPIWVDGVIVHDEAEELAHRTALAEAAADARRAALAQPPSSAALRMRRSRQRRRDGYVRVQFNITARQVEMLVAAGHIQSAAIVDATDVARGIVRLLDGLGSQGLD